jgi:diaminopimelate epimerase
MQKIPFFKMCGSGNDFIIIDNRQHGVDENNLPEFIAAVCRRKMSVGADGIILVEDSDTVDFKWRFFNSDGSVGEMCGNGARCVARFAYENRIADEKMAFETLAGIISAQVIGDRVKIKMTDPSPALLDQSLDIEGRQVTFSSINTGVPHVVIPVADVDTADVVPLGRLMRWHAAFQPEGTNVNFISSRKPGTFAIRTYERGVEDETLACGTGSVAGALIMAMTSGAVSPVYIITRSNCVLTIYFKKESNGFRDVFLEGDARIIYRGQLGPDACLNLMAS